MVFPNRRPVYFLRKYLAEEAGKPLLMPAMYSITDFFRKQTRKAELPAHDKVFLLYRAYKTVGNRAGWKIHSFSRFLSWSSILLKDFEEADKFLVDVPRLFQTIAGHKEIDEWAQSMETGNRLLSDYVNFFKHLPGIYETYKKEQEKAGLADDGTLYREAFIQKEKWSEKFEENTLLFAGFNALTRAEEEIFLYLQKHKKARFFWDADKFYLNKPFEAGKFLRKNKKKFSREDFRWIYNEFTPEKKEIKLVEAPENISQIQYTAGVLSGLSGLREEDWLRTAVVLPDPSLFYPFLFSLPPGVPSVNLTFGLPVQYLKIYRILRQYLRLLIQISAGKLIDKDEFIAFLKHPYVLPALPPDLQKNPAQIFDLKYIKNLYPDYFLRSIRQKKLQDLFEPPAGINDLLKKLRHFLTKISPVIRDLPEKWALMEIDRVLENALQNKDIEDWADDPAEMEKVIHYLLRGIQLEFAGEPLKGLQVMGLLETRLLDFDRVFILSLNEGILPRNKAEDSFIPLEIRKYFGLPVYEDHNAVSAYHLYRLIGHSRENHLIYTANVSDFSRGEKSRFVQQLEWALPQRNMHPRHIRITNRLSTAGAVKFLPNDHEAIERLKNKLQQKISPSFILAYLHHPDQFYKRYVLVFEEPETSEDVINDRLLGDVLHHTMETLYKNLTGRPVDVQTIQSLLKKYEPLSEKFFYEKYLGLKNNVKEIPLTGENLLALQAIKHIIKKILENDLRQVENGAELIILDLEKPLSFSREVEGMGQLTFYGKADRIDRLNGQLRVVDFKTGNVKLRLNPQHENWTVETFKTNPDSKIPFQLLFYAWLMAHDPEYSSQQVKPVVISPRTTGMEAGLKFDVTPEMLQSFETVLVQILKEIISPDTRFELKEKFGSGI